MHSSARTGLFAFVFAGFALGLAACTPPMEIVAKARAANDFKCSEDAVNLSKIAGTSYRLEGCGKSDIYDCRSTGNSASDFACVPEGRPASP